MKARIYLNIAAAVAVMTTTLAALMGITGLPWYILAACVTYPGVINAAKLRHTPGRTGSRAVPQHLTDTTATLAATLGIGAVNVQFVSTNSPVAHATIDPVNNNIGVSDALVALSEENSAEAEAVLAHELGHLAHRGTLPAFFTYITLGTAAVILAIFATPVLAVETRWATLCLTWAVTGAGIGTGGVFFLAAKRCGEYYADSIAAQLGYAEPLCAVLATFTEPRGGTWRNTHPSPQARINALRARH